MRAHVLILSFVLALVPAVAGAQTRANTVDPDGTTALHWAVRDNDLPRMERLLRAGADPNAANRYGITPIYLACQNGSAKAVSRLLKAGVSPNATGPFGETALMTCAHTGVVDAAKVLIEAGASVDAVESWRGQTALMWAAAEGHPEMMRALIAAGADVNARSAIQNWERQRTLEPRDKWLPPGGLTPLLFATRQGCVECVRVLLDAKADIDVVDPDEISGLVSALINGHYDVAALLIDRGIDVNLPDKTGRTALYAAVDDHTMPTSNRPSPKEIDNRLTSLDIIDSLLAHGANVNAALRSQIPYRTKLDRGGDTALTTGTTPLMRAAKAGDTAVVKLLLAHGADPKAETRFGINALMLAADVGTREEDMTGRGKTEAEAIDTIGLLKAAGVDINAQDSQGRSAAYGAALWGRTDVVKFLVKNGARLDLSDRRGFTPLDAAMGLVGGLGFDGKTGDVHEETAKAIRDLGGKQGEPKGAALPGPGAVAQEAPLR
ncbi:MAG TPA: ankyrin repeat domain-containing protein [Vicinamibacterales bacterium]|nr:ankyrin repeat domain-containing protein [Vicinamibacterales bacterium]